MMETVFMLAMCLGMLKKKIFFEIIISGFSVA